VSARITIVRPGLPLPRPARGELAVSFDDFRKWVLTGRVFRHIARHGEGRLLVPRLETAGRPLPLGLALRALSRGRLYLEDVHGRTREVGATTLARWVGQIATEPFRVTGLLRRIDRSLARLEGDLRRPSRVPPLNLAASPAYLRTDLSFDVRAGGSVAHTAGVINHFEPLTGAPIVLTTASIPTLRPDIETHDIVPDEAFWNFRELPGFLLNQTLDATARRVLGPRTLAFVYQRYTLNTYAGIQLARAQGVPLLTEYNGSEVWVARHWGRPLKYERLSARIELLNLRAADLISVVSRRLARELIDRGIEAHKILVNPNGVDPERYRPDVHADPIRARYGLSDKTVIGFIGTFGPWHGAEVLAKAVVRLLQDRPRLRETSRVLWIGDGVTLPHVRTIVRAGGAADACVFTGLVPQEAGAAHLAACDILVSPHVPNPDGSPFFGSPTKLFEYMAMGRGIVASDLEQIGEVLEEGHTALLVPPGDPHALAVAIARMIDEPALRETLGSQARGAVLARYTWREHVRRTIERLQVLVEGGADDTGRRASAPAPAPSSR